jgi:release factor glutamine methyltransferase
MTIDQALQAAATLGLARLDAQLLLLHVLGQRAQGRAWLLAHAHDALPTTASTQFIAAAQRCAGGEPLAYITGWQEFYGLTLQVDPRVLIPRPDTETLVDWALERIDQDAPPSTAQRPPFTVLDLGTGSGAIALAIQHQRPQVKTSAVDASPAALAVAGANAQRLKLKLQFIHSHWFAQVPGRYALIVSNPPYIAEHDPHLAALSHEPVQALTAGPDGLADIRHLIQTAPQHLLPGGWLLLEHGHNQASAVQQLLGEQGFTHIQSRSDLAGTERCCGGQLMQ